VGMSRARDTGGGRGGVGICRGWQIENRRSRRPISRRLMGVTEDRLSWHSRECRELRDMCECVVRGGVVGCGVR